MAPRIIPAPAQPSLAVDQERAIAFSSRGEWFVCWTLAKVADSARLVEYRNN